MCTAGRAVDGSRQEKFAPGRDVCASSLEAGASSSDFETDGRTGSVQGKGFFSKRFHAFKARASASTGADFGAISTREMYRQKQRAMRSDPCSMACRRNCEAGACSVCFQAVVGVALLVAVLWLSAYLMQLVELAGVTGTPPGILHASYRGVE